MRRIIIITSLVAILLTAGLLSCSKDNEGIISTGPVDYITTIDGYSWTYDVKTYGGPYQNYTKTETVSGTRDIGGTTCQVLETTYSNIPDYVERTFFIDDATTTFAHWGVEYEEASDIVYTNDYGRGYPIYRYPFEIGGEWDIYSVTGANPSELPVFTFYWAFYENDVDGDDIDDTVDMTITAEIKKQMDITVPAGTFEDCYHIKFTVDAVYHMSDYGDLEAMGSKEIWYKPYIGLIRSHLSWIYIGATDQEIMELMSYELPD